MKDNLRRLYAFAAMHDGIFSTEQARDHGLSENEIRYLVRQDWNTLYGGVFLAPGAPLTWRGRLRAACLAGAPHAAASHRSAAALYEVPGANRALVELTCPRWLRTQHEGLVVHERCRVNPADTQLIDGIPVTRPELVALQLASIYRSPDFVERVLHAMRRKRLITFVSTDAMLRRHARRGVRGVKVMRAALDRWDPAQRPTESDMEIRLLQILREQGVRDLVPQYEIFDQHGRFVARVDLALVRLRIGIEYESNEYHLDEISIAKDDARRNRAFSVGWVILKARHHDVKTGARELVAALRPHLASKTQLECANSTQVA